MKKYSWLLIGTLSVLLAVAQLTYRPTPLSGCEVARAWYYPNANERYSVDSFSQFVEEVFRTYKPTTAKGLFGKIEYTIAVRRRSTGEFIFHNFHISLKGKIYGQKKMSISESEWASYEKVLCKNL